MLMDRSVKNMYNLEKKDIRKYSKEFNKTYCGKWINRFSLLPGGIVVVSVLLMIISVIDSYLEPTNTFYNLEGVLYFISLVISGSIFAVTQLFYYNMLDKYISRSSK